MKKFEETSRNFGESKNFLSSVFCPLHLIWFEMWCDSIRFDSIHNECFELWPHSKEEYLVQFVVYFWYYCPVSYLWTFQQQKFTQILSTFFKSVKQTGFTAWSIDFCHSFDSRPSWTGFFNVLFDFNSENWIKESKLKYICILSRARYSDDMNQNVSIENF